LEGKALVLARSRSAEIVQGLPDISGEDGRYGFSKSWEWTHEIPTPENWDGAANFETTAGTQNLARARRFTARNNSISHSSTGKNTRLAATESCMSWNTDFGKFRGMAGVPAGSLEIFASEFSLDLGTPKCLEFNHPLNSWIATTVAGIGAGTQFKIFTGGRFTLWFCDGLGENFSQLGNTENSSEILRWAENKTELELVFADKSMLTFSATTGEITAYQTREGKVWTATEIDEYLDIVRDEEGVLRQIKNLWDGLANIVPATNGNAYTIELFLPEQIGEKSAITSLYATTGTPFKTFSVSVSEDGKFSAVEQDSCADAIALPCAAWLENGVWCDSFGTGEEKITTRRSRTDLDATHFRVVIEKFRGSNAVAETCDAEEFEVSTLVGDLLISRTEGYGSANAQTSTFEHDDAGRVVKETRPDGSVLENSYDNFGRLSSHSEPFANARNKNTRYVYLSGTDNRPELSYTETQISQTNSHVVYSRTDYTHSETTEYKREERRTTALAASESRLEVTETWFGTCGNAFARGRVKMTQATNGVQTHYDYAKTNLHGALYAETQETRVAETPVNGKSTRRVRYISSDGNVVFEENFVLDVAGTWQKISEFSAEFDAFNNEISRTRGNGRQSTREMMCCGPLWEIDEDGVRTDFVYDSARRLTEKTRALTATNPERCTIYERDVRGNATQEILKLNSVNFSSKTQTYDILGRIRSGTDELGRVTQFAYALGASQTSVTRTLSNGATRITTTHADGTTLAPAGTAPRNVETQTEISSSGICKIQRLAGTSGNERERGHSFEGNDERFWRNYLH